MPLTPFIVLWLFIVSFFFFFQAEDGIRDLTVTGVQTCALPIWVMRRAGVRLPEAMTSTFMTFVATVAFFALAGPLAIYLGAGRSLAAHNVVLGITYYGLFRASLTIFGVLGVLMLVAMVDRKSTRLNSS